MEDPGEELLQLEEFSPATTGQKIGLALFILVCIAAIVVAAFSV